MKGKPILFVWIPKTGGTNIYMALNTRPHSRKVKLNNPVDIKNFKNNFEWKEDTCVTFGHSSIKSLVELNVIPMDFMEKAFKIVFVRNPWDRLVSLYHFMTNLKDQHYYQICPHERRPFPQFIKDLYRGELKIAPPDEYNIHDLNAASDQTAWLESVESLGFEFDFIGMFENFAQDSERLGKMIKQKMMARKVNASQHSWYPTYYDEKLKNMVAEMYHKEIKRFNYSFHEKLYY